MWLLLKIGALFDLCSTLKMPTPEFFGKRFIPKADLSRIRVPLGLDPPRGPPRKTHLSNLTLNSQ